MTDRPSNPVAKRMPPILRFLVLLFWTYPFKREKDGTTKRETSLPYTMFIMGSIIIPLIGQPDIPAGEFPAFEQLSVISGKIIRHPTFHGTKYSSEPLAIESGNGEVRYFQCARLGNKCYENAEWDALVGRSASVRFWTSNAQQWPWVIQLEVDGHVVKGDSYDASRRLRTKGTLFLWWYLSFPFGVWLILRVIRRYGRSAWSEAMGDATTSGSN